MKLKLSMSYRQRTPFRRESVEVHILESFRRGRGVLTKDSAWLVAFKRECLLSCPGSYELGPSGMSRLPKGQRIDCKTQLHTLHDGAV